PEAEYQRAAAELALGNLAEAEASLRRATELRQDWSLAWGMLGDVLVRKYSAGEAASRPEMLKDAAVALKKALELDPANTAAVTALVELQLNSDASPDMLRET